MRVLAPVLLLWSMCPALLAAEHPEPRRPHDVGELEAAALPVGRLGLPLGTVVPIEAVIIDGSTAAIKKYDGMYLLRIESVQGRKPAKPFPMVFESHIEGLPTNTFDLQ